MVWDAKRLGDPGMVEYFRRRAVGSAVVTGVIALAGIVVLHDDATYVFHGLTSRALPLVILSALCGVGSIVLLMRSSHTGARLLAMGAVATVVVGWGVAQYPYILPTSLKLSAAASPDATLWSVVVVFVVAALVILPSLGLLYYLDQRDLLAAPALEPGLDGDQR
jgi:cytochrome bd ubiquinol oxidase subunit II